MDKNIVISIGLNTGGAETMLLKLLTQMPLEKRKSYIIISLLDEGIIGAKILELNIPVIALYVNTFFGFLLFPLNLVKILFKYRINSLIGWMYHGNLIALIMWFLSFGQKRLVWNIRHSIYDLAHEKKTTQYLIKAGAVFSKFTSVIIVNSQESLRQHASLGYKKEKCVYIPNGFDSKRFFFSENLRYKRRGSLNIKNDDILIGMIARNHPIKDYVTFVDAMSLVHKYNKDIKFIAVGRGVDTDRLLLDKIVKLGLINNFILLPEDKDTPSLFNALDIFCLTSLSEGFPNVVGEAMLCGAFTIATNVGQTRDILGELGVVVPVKSPLLIANSIIEYLQKTEQDRELLKNNAVKSIIERYDIKYITEQYCKLFGDGN